MPLFEKVQKLLREPAKSSANKTISVHPLLKRFESLQDPPPRVCKDVQSFQKDPSTLMQHLNTHKQYSDWFALHIVRAIQDQPRLSKSYVEGINQAGPFWKTVFQAAVAQSLQIILSPKIDTYEGALSRRRLVLLGRLIGELTIAVDRPLFSRFLDVKKLLLYAFSQGKLYAVVPFVTAIFFSSSQHYSARNPFVASILQILAAVFKANAIKLGIKHHIQALFSRLGVSLSLFASVPELFPDKWQGNYDFVLTPFSLHRLATPAEIDRIANFDEPTFTTILTPQVFIPDHPDLARFPEIAERLRAKIIAKAFSIVQSEGEGLSRAASSTANSLIAKDFSGAAESDQMIEDAVILTKQLCAGLTLFRAPMKLQRPFFQHLHNGEEALDQDWLDQVARRNYDWVIQLLRDVVEFRALRVVHQVIDKSEELRNQAAQTRSRVLSSPFLPPKPGLSPQQQQIYAELSDLSLSQQAYPVLEGQTKSKTAVAIDPDFDKQLSLLVKQIPLDSSRPSEGFDENTTRFVDTCAKMVDKQISPDRFQLILKTILKHILKANHDAFERIMCQALGQMCQAVTRKMIADSQPLVVTWVRTWLRGQAVIREFVRLGLLTVPQLDELLTELLNADPLNTRNMWSIVRLVKYLLIDVQAFPEHEMTSTLSVLCAIPRGQIDPGPPGSNILPFFDDLRKRYEEMDSPAAQQASTSKLEFVSTFDPREEIPEAPRLVELVQQWRALLGQPSEGELEEFTRQIVGKSLAIVLFYAEPLKVCVQFAACVQEFVKRTDDLLEALVAIIAGNLNVIGFDMRKYYSILRFMVESCDDFVKFAVVLHRLRPLKMPSFALNWVQLVADKALVFGMLQTKETWPSFGVLVLDFAATVASIDPKDQQAFPTVYRAFLRFMLVLAHDFRPFVSAVASALVSVIPVQFTQVRNIVLATAEPTSFVLFGRQDLGKAFLREGVEGEIEPKTIGPIVQALEKKADGSSVRFFVETVCEPGIRGDEQARVHAVLVEVFRQASPDLAAAIVNGIVDQVRFKGVESRFYNRVIVGLFREGIEVNPQVNLSEIILRVVMERASTPPPRPVKLGSLVRHLLAPGEGGRDVWNMPFVATNASVRDFLKAAQAMFQPTRK
jgi:CCR4-NOT transcription complex subunit 1